MKGRTTVYNNITNPENLSQINPDNLWLIKEFLSHLNYSDRSKLTQEKYDNALKIFFVWNLNENENKRFVDIKKREFEKFMGYCLDEWHWSPKRVRFLRSVLSSMSNFIENDLYEEDGYEGYRNIILKIEPPSNQTVRDKSMLSEEQVKLLLDTLESNQEFEKACCVAILAYSGMRKAELLQMKMSYFDDDHLKYGCIYVTDKVRAKGRGRLGKPLNKYVLNKVKKYIDLWETERKMNNIDTDYIFAVKRGDYWDKREYIDNWNDEFSEILGIPIYPHAFRHYFTTTAINEYSIPEDIVTFWNGWADSSMIKHYNDKTAEDRLSMFFNEDGMIKQTKNNDITSMSQM